MHDGPNPVYHRDIREPNIIRRSDGQGWFLIDWSDASTIPTVGVQHLTELEHSPRVREENHGPEVDIWGIGRYMEELASCSQGRIANPGAVQQMARRWKRDTSTTATRALDEVKVSVYHLNIRWCVDTPYRERETFLLHLHPSDSRGCDDQCQKDRSQKNKRQRERGQGDDRWQDETQEESTCWFCRWTDL